MTTWNLSPENSCPQRTAVCRGGGASEPDSKLEIRTKTVKEASAAHCALAYSVKDSGFRPKDSRFSKKDSGFIQETAGFTQKNSIFVQQGSGIDTKTRDLR